MRRLRGFHEWTKQINETLDLEALQQRVVGKSFRRTKLRLLLSKAPVVGVVYRAVTCQNGNEKELQRISLCSEEEKYSARDQGLRYFSEKS